MQGRTITETKEEIDRLWEEVLEMRKRNGECRDSPQKEKAISLMHQWARESMEGKIYFQRKRAEIRWRLAEMEYREGKYISALLQVVKGFHICKEIEEISAEDLMANLNITEGKINMALSLQ